MGVDRSGYEMQQLSAVENEWSGNSTPLFIFMVWSLIKRRNRFIFLVHLDHTYKVRMKHVYTARKLDVISHKLNTVGEMYYWR
jgi:hypothetical protein